MLKALCVELVERDTPLVHRLRPGGCKGELLSVVECIIARQPRTGIPKRITTSRTHSSQNVLRTSFPERQNETNLKLGDFPVFTRLKLRDFGTFDGL